MGAKIQAFDIFQAPLFSLPTAFKPLRRRFMLLEKPLAQQRALQTWIFFLFFRIHWLDWIKIHPARIRNTLFSSFSLCRPFVAVRLISQTFVAGRFVAGCFVGVLFNILLQFCSRDAGQAVVQNAFCEPGRPDHNQAKVNIRVYSWNWCSLRLESIGEIFWPFSPAGARTCVPHIRGSSRAVSEK